MKINTPQTICGKWAFGGFLSFLFFMFIFFGMIISGQKGGTGFFDNMLLTGPFLIAVISAFIMFLSALWELIVSKNRALWVWIIMVIGGFVTWFMAMELLFPH